MMRNSLWHWLQTNSRQEHSWLVHFNKSESEQTENKYQPSLTNPRNRPHHGKRAAQKGGCSVW